MDKLCAKYKFGFVACPTKILHVRDVPIVGDHGAIAASDAETGTDTVKRESYLGAIRRYQAFLSVSSRWR